MLSYGLVTELRGRYKRAGIPRRRRQAAIELAGELYLEGGGNVTGMHLMPRDHGPHGPSRTTYKGNSFKHDPY
jgi:hypothetical protein